MSTAPLLTITQSNAQLAALRARFAGERGGVQWYKVIDAREPGGWYRVGRQIDPTTGQYVHKKLPANACNC